MEIEAEALRRHYDDVRKPVGRRQPGRGDRDHEAVVVDDAGLDDGVERALQAVVEIAAIVGHLDAENQRDRAMHRRHVLQPDGGYRMAQIVVIAGGSDPAPAGQVAEKRVDARRRRHCEFDRGRRRISRYTGPGSRAPRHGLKKGGSHCPPFPKGAPPTAGRQSPWRAASRPAGSAGAGAAATAAVVLITCAASLGAGPNMSGRSSWREMPVRRSMSSTRATGTPARSQRSTVDLFSDKSRPNASSVRFRAAR